ncbi:MAG: hypothetical protein ACYCRD_06760 [Leptospirillum sp.]
MGDNLEQRWIIVDGFFGKNFLLLPAVIMNPAGVAGWEEGNFML